MTSVRLRPFDSGPPYRLTAPAGDISAVQGVHYRCFIRLPRRPMAVDGIVDTGAPFTVIPERLWDKFVEGVDFDWLTTDPPGAGRVLSRSYTFRFARLLVPLAVEDYVTSVPRTDVIAQFADGDPLGSQSRLKVLIGLWGGLLDPSKLTLDGDPTSGVLSASLEFA